MICSESINWVPQFRKNKKLRIYWICENTIDKMKTNQDKEGNQIARELIHDSKD